MAPISDQFPTLNIASCPKWQDYELLDSGNGRKLERFAAYRLIRPEAEAIWQPALEGQVWESADAEFQPSGEEHGGHWDQKHALPERWQMGYKSLKFWAQTTASRHLGIFPEQASQWDWVEKLVKNSQRPLKVLNLFGYTGLATLAAAHAGALVTHVDASRKVVAWGQENQQLSNLQKTSVRWLVDDAVKFVQREARRNSTYDGIILDPPKFGRGPKGEVWEFYKLIPELMQSCRSVLSARPKFIVLTAYAVKASALTLYYSMQEIMAEHQGNIDAGEIVIPEQSGGRLLSTAIYARWSSSVG
jgi:23S rRNA (cytosine1962-C5)-methyltransferase